ncbi:flagellar protein FliS [Kineosphaera limosa]|uniref:Flagellar secretion chaperone FliS n=1 Tax=Kineosphaera limosa NBRC 100340 TaxID=1184609 RepID=K6WDW6_9MICO|nr:flagellar export chaperone FliS [Kineosphaera limosa]NYD99840.1 flagellar protein FliS [Kineosphaera limosa]GAB97485.1 putative flagellar protein FliS [Kineosphaera limosa NBRC 100340]
MSTQAQLRNRYAREAVATATPAQLLMMLYDRLIKDLNAAETGLGARDIQATHSALIHAQDIVHELSATLDTTLWKEGEALQRLYAWVIEQLIEANMTKDVQFVHNAREVVEPIRDAWHQVASAGVTGQS